ncbi:MAG: hypothetical protein IH946_12080, partial [Bacteroidetes bacterium]|nr:hypothetical protein [Bacteroidota bacterium]
FYKHGLAYKKKAKVNWCPECATVLANEQVVQGACERCDTLVIQKDLLPWFFKITDYAQRVVEDLDILKELIPDKKHEIYDIIHNLFVEIDWVLDDHSIVNFNQLYDQIVSVGELVSTRIVSTYLNEVGIKNQWLDVREVLKTDDNYREANVDWELSTKLCLQQLPALLNEQLIITQGFIGVTSENYTTTLGREGSDFTGAIFANILDAKRLTVWKDVEGILNADPQETEDAVKINNLSFYEMIEMAFYGAKVVHPKTVKPLQNKNIEFIVNSFKDPGTTGTVIKRRKNDAFLPPIIVWKRDQLLLSLTTRDFSFISEKKLSFIYGLFAEEQLKINMMQMSALTFTACFDNKPQKVEKIQKALEETFEVKHNDGLELLTIRHYNESTISDLIKGKRIMLEQKSRNTIQLVLEDQ